MESSLTITIRPSWRDVDADGSKCLCCGDKIFMMQKRLCLAIDSRTIVEMDGVNLCGSCAYAVIDSP